MSLTKVSYSMITGAPVNVLDFGADNTGATDSTAAIQAAVNSLTSKSVLVINPGTYKITTVTFDALSGIEVSCYGAQINLVGDGAGFVVKGICAGITVKGGTITGDGANRDSGITPQIGWLFGDAPGAYVQNVFLQDVIVDSANIGFKFSAGTGTGSGNTNNVKVVSCQALNSIGLVGGRGYGFSFSQANYSSLVNCQAINCQRHGIYFAEGFNYTATNCILRDHRSTVSTNAYRVAFSISRSRNVAVSNCLFDNCYDGSLEIDSDTQGTAPYNVLDGVTVTGCAFYNSKLADIRIGTDPVIDANVENVMVSDCVMVRSNNTISSVVIESAIQLKIQGCLIRGYGSSSSRAIVVKGTGGASYTENIDITNNQITNWDFGIQINSNLQTGTSSIRLLNNKISATTAELEFVSGENATTNNNLIYTRSNNVNAFRVYSSSGSNVVIPVGGVNAITLDASSSTTIANFSGGTEGQELTCSFNNGNTTLLASTFYLAGAVNFTGTTSDTLTLIYMQGLWREKCRSIN